MIDPFRHIQALPPAGFVPPKEVVSLPPREPAKYKAFDISPLLGPFTGAEGKKSMQLLSVVGLAYFTFPYLATAILMFVFYILGQPLK